MDSSIGYATFIASLLLCLSSSPTPFANARASSLIRSVCKQTQDQFGYNYKRCVKSLWKDIPTRSASNLKDLDTTILKLALTNAQQSKAFFVNALNTTGNNIVKGSGAVKQCANSYDFAVDGFAFSVRGIKDNDKSVSQILTQVQDEIVRCEKALTSTEIELPYLVSSTNFLTMLYRDVAFLITSQLFHI
ncbi:uncharacterized protein LOC126620936 [Malus sylvestris]|uniref:uncharacterized protein LOC126620936 n=2 Tax=Malus sylvestris TaxID=3752 RepID=UPI0021AD07E2|nr:uncharacterized protein LOC126620936 [Malus sylvestris]